MSIGRRWGLAALCAAACGRSGYDPVIAAPGPADAAPGDAAAGEPDGPAPPDSPVRPADAPEVDAFDPYPDASDPDASVPDATVVILACPADMVLVETFIIAMSYCIDMAEAGNQDWVMAGATCASLGKRLCRDDEWGFACGAAPAGLVDMSDGDWEWTSDLASPTVARKRGWNACTDTSTHAITPDPYLFHCCRDPL